MTLIISSLNSTDAIKRVPIRCWLGPFDDPNGYPNFPRFMNAQGEVQETWETATHCGWDGRFGAETVRLIQAISLDPSKVPEDVTELTREALIALYGLEVPDGGIEDE